MEGGSVMEKQEQQQQQQQSSSSAASYTYWVREVTGDAAPPPVPRKLSAEDLSKGQQASSTLGSVWNQAGTWEERNLNSWACNRIKELLGSLSCEFVSGRADIKEVSKCSGDAFLVIVRNKKRVGYTYELTLKFKGEWVIDEEKKPVKGHLDVPEFTFGELEDLQIDVSLSEVKDLATVHADMIVKDLKSFLPIIREKLLIFEQELKDR